MEKDNIVINTLVFMNSLDDGVKQSSLLRDIHALGIEKVEVRREFIKSFDEELQEIRKTAEELQIELYYSVPRCLYDDGELKTSEIEECFIEANKMGCENVKMNIGDYHHISNEDVCKVNSLCNKYSIKLTVENNQTEEEGRSDKIKEFLETSEKLGLKVYCTFDIGNWLWLKEDPKENAYILKKFTTYIHLKDVSMNGEPQTVLLDEGVIPWRSILGIFDKSIPVALEYPCYPDTLTRLKAEIDKLQKVD